MLACFEGPGCTGQSSEGLGEFGVIMGEGGGPVATE